MQRIKINFHRKVLLLVLIALLSGVVSAADAVKKRKRTVGPDRKKYKELQAKMKQAGVAAAATIRVAQESEDPKKRRQQRIREDRSKKAIERRRAFAKASKIKRAVLASRDQLDQKVVSKIDKNKRLNRKDKKKIDIAEFDTYRKMRKKGVDEVSNTKESKMLRDYRLRNKKKRGIFRKKEASLSQILFPGVSPEDYRFNEKVWIYTDLVQSRLTPVPFDVYDLPGYYEEEETVWLKKQRLRRNLGSRLLGHDAKPAPFDIRVEKDVPCTVFGKSYIGSKELQWLRQLVERQYRVHLQLDGLPILLKSHDLNFALRGYPIGFKLPDDEKIYLYNHLKFTITYHEDASVFEGIRITGFEVHPVSIMHDNMGESCSGHNVENQADRGTFVSLEKELGTTPILFSYDVKWVPNENVEWSDRWDVYLVGSPDDDIHFYSIVNSLMIVFVMTVAISSIMVRTLRNDIAGYNELVDLEDGDEDTGWKLVHGDVFRAPSFCPMALSVLVGTGAQIGVSACLAIVLSVVHVTNAMNKGQMLTSLVLLYVFCGAIAGYVSSRIYGLTKGTSWKLNTLLTATALPGVFAVLFTVLNLFLNLVHASSAVSFLTICSLFLLWICVSAPLVFLGAFIGLRNKGLQDTCRTNSIARIIPDSVWSTAPVVTSMLGGVLPFGAVCIELAFIMSALWLHQLYYVMGFLLAVGAVLLATCAQVSIVMCYLQLCAEDYRWWWKSFWNCATGGIYIFLYSIWFLSSRMKMVGLFPVIIYLTYMAMISIFFGIFCGAVGYLSSLWFTRKIYSSLKSD